MGILSAGDWLILGTYLLLIFVIAWRKGREERTTEDFVVGGRQIPWWAVLGSIVATEISAITFLNVPGTAFTGDLSYLQFGIGSILGRVVVATVFLGAFYRGRHLTVYSYLHTRFGAATRYAATALFLLSRLLGSGLRLSLAALGMSLIFDLSFLLTLFLFTCLAVLYTIWGGIKAIVWTDLVQAAVFIGSGVAVAGWLQAELGWGVIWDTARDAGKTQLFHWEGGAQAATWLGNPQFFLLAALNGLLATTASLGTDQDLTQRMLTCRDPRGAKVSVIASGLVGVPVAGLFLCLGLGFFALHTAEAGWLAGAVVDGEVAANHVFPQFIREGAPHLLRGLLTAGVFAAAMSSIDSAMGALSSVAVLDLYKPLFRPQADDTHLLRANRVAVLGSALVLFGLAYAFGQSTDHLWLALQVASIPAGAMLGLFLLGLTTRRGSDRGNLLALAVSLAVTAALFLALRAGLLALAWTWLILIGMVLSFGLGALFRPPTSPSPHRSA
ncbi:MAG: sodium:solute symporter family transporter [Opitutales bacterium]